MVTESERIITSEIVKRLNQADVRMREGEQEFAKLEDAVRGAEDALSGAVNDFNSRLEKMNSDLASAALAMDDIKRQMGDLKKDLENAVKKDEFKEVSNYINLMNPALTTFVTRDEVRRMIEESKGK